MVGDVTDNSGFVFSQDEESLDIPVSMEAALTEQLTEEGLLATGDDAGYAINPTINEYEPGNAFARWLLPGAGSTILKVSSDIQTPDKAPVATIETTNTIYAGGAYTIGAWRSIFESGAEEIVEQLKKSMGLLEASDGPQPVS
ncbi:MAG: DUF4410 domain-containing protein [Alphaproteobacteria bacterium]|nr:DUF4410 domain-containing protein [Alphaproteobacteria bacterium]